MIARKMAPALAAGCTIGAKPAEDTPLTSLALAVLAQEAGIPAGVLNVVTASGHASQPVGRSRLSSRPFSDYLVGQQPETALASPSEVLFPHPCSLSRRPLLGTLTRALRRRDNSTRDAALQNHIDIPPYP